MLFGQRKVVSATLSGKKIRFRCFSQLSLGSKISLFVLLLLVVAAIFAPLLAPHNPTSIYQNYQEPSGMYWFGTDNLGRDVFSRLLYGARYSLVIGLISIGFALLLGSLIGAIAAVSRIWISEIIMRIIDIVMSVPGIALAAVFVTILGQSMIGIIISIGILYVPQIARVVRANIISEYGKDYVRAVIVSGAKAPWILLKHVTRNIAAPVMVFTTLSVADAIVFEASLSFINAGIPEPTPTWGNILSSAKEGVLYGYWWQALFPGLAIMITVLCLNILSENLTDALVAAPTSQALNLQTSEARRKEDRLLSDPVAAYAEQEKELESALSALRQIEWYRKDRYKYSYPSAVLAATSTADSNGASATFSVSSASSAITSPTGIPALSEMVPVLEVKDLCIRFPRHGEVDVVDHVSFTVRPGETMGLVGESGCGKSITALAIMGLLDPKASVTGTIRFNGRDLNGLRQKEYNQLRGSEIAMIYQDALSSLNPSMLIKSQMKQLTKRGGTRSAEELLELVGLDPERTLNSYPHELSGGQRQRVLIAMALTRDPKLVIADEPTTALDVTVQNQIVALLHELREKLGFAMVFVSHDLALVAQVTHSVTVMYAGQVVEQGSTQDILLDPRHEYTRGLLGSVISIENGSERLYQIPGTVPSPADFPPGDRFAPRSSNPSAGSTMRPVMRQVPETQHYYADSAKNSEQTKQAGNTVRDTLPARVRPPMPITPSTSSMPSTPTTSSRSAMPSTQNMGTSPDEPGTTTEAQR